jgi:hypothetical protein
MSKSRWDQCVYILIGALFTGALATFVFPLILPGIDTLWITIGAAITGMVFASMLLFFQDRSKQKKYRGQVS